MRGCSATGTYFWSSLVSCIQAEFLWLAPTGSLNRFEEQWGPSAQCPHLELPSLLFLSCPCIHLDSWSSGPSHKVEGGAFRHRWSHTHLPPGNSHKASPPWAGPCLHC